MGALFINSRSSAPGAPYNAARLVVARNNGHKVLAAAFLRERHFAADEGEERGLALVEPETMEPKLRIITGR